MHNGKTVSIGNILWRILRQPIAADLTYDQAAEFALEFIRLVGAPLSFEDKITNPPLTITNHKAELPKDLLNVKGIKYQDTPLRYATDIYHGSEDYCNTEYTYTLQNCIITTSMKDGEIVVSYKAISTDENGYPLVPDNESFKMGLEYYILHRYLEPLWTMGKITDKVFQYYEQKRHFYVGQAANSLVIGNLDLLESAMNAINRLIVDVNPHNSSYKNFGEKEYIKKHS